MKYLKTFNCEQINDLRLVKKVTYELFTKKYIYLQDLALNNHQYAIKLKMIT